MQSLPPEYFIEIYDWEKQKLIMNIKIQLKEINSEPKKILFANKNEIYVVGEKYFKYIMIEKGMTKQESNLKINKCSLRNIVRCGNSNLACLLEENSKIVLVDKNRLRGEYDKSNIKYLKKALKIAGFIIFLFNCIKSNF